MRQVVCVYCLSYCEPWSNDVMSGIAAAPSVTMCCSNSFHPSRNPSHEQGSSPSQPQPAPASASTTGSRASATMFFPIYQLHGVWRVRISDWYENSFIMVSYENFFSRALDRKFWLNFIKNFLTDSHYKTIFGSVRMACSSYTMVNLRKSKPKNLQHMYWLSLSTEPIYERCQEMFPTEVKWQKDFSS